MGAVEENAESAAFVGKTLAEKYRVERVIGVGGMGFVVAATHLHIDEPVALKLLYSSFAADAEIVKRFMREAKAARKIRSEHVVRVLDVGTLENGAPYLVMEQLHGQDLEQVLRRTGRQPVATALDVLLQASEALAEAHVQKMVHRDLKPANLFVTKRPDGDALVKVLDFGISKVTGAGGADLGQTQAGDAILGSPQYMAPEQLRSLKDVDARTDIWALGAMLYEMLVGVPPFNASSLPELVTGILDKPAPSVLVDRPDVPPGLDAVIRSCLEKEREGRPRDIATLASMLAPFGPPSVQASAARINGVFRTARAPMTLPLNAVNPLAANAMGMSPSPSPIAVTTSNPPSQHPPPFEPPSMRGSNPPPTLQSVPPPGPIGVTTTGKAWGRDRTSAGPPAPANQAGLIAAVLGGVAVVIGLLVVFVAIPKARAYRESSAASATVTTAEPPASTVAISPPPPVVSAEPEPEPEPAVSASASAEPATSASAAPPASESAEPVVKPSAPKVDCTQKFTLDRDGTKRWKRECF